MIRSYFKIAFRNLWRHKGFTLINVTGLALGLACSIVIFLYVRGETGYDQYHEHGDQIYRLTLEVEGIKSGSVWKSATSSILWAPALQQDYPEVKETCRVMSENSELRVDVSENIFFEDKIVYADANLFNFFSWPLLEGDASTALSEPFTLILSERIARKYFGEHKALGKVLKITKGKRDESGELIPHTYEFKVSGVIRNIPYKSHLKPDIIVSFITLNHFFEADVTAGVHPYDWFWRGRLVHNYVLLPEQAEPERLEAKLPEFLDKYVGDATVTRGYRYHPYLEALDNIHLEGSVASKFEPGTDKNRLYLFSGSALFILLLACINFMNLSTARSSARVREVGIRKVIGARRKRLVVQFLGESVLLSMVALIFALFLFEMINPVFYTYIGKEFYLPDSDLFWSAAGIFGITVLVGLLAGTYPALYLSSFHPASILKSDFSASPRSTLFRKTMVITQFVITVFFIIATLALYFQLQFMQSQKLGFTEQPVLVLPQNVTKSLLDQADAYRTELKAHSGIMNVSIASAVPGRAYGGDVWVEEGKAGDQGFGLQEFAVDYQYLELFDLEMVSGRGFMKAMGTDAAPANIEKSGFELSAIVNESAVKAFGWASAQDALQRRIIRDPVSNDFTGKIIGVIKDFHYESLQEPIEPMVFFINPHYSSEYRYMAIKLSGTNIPQTIDFIRKTVSRAQVGEGFDFFFIDDDFQRLYEDDQRMLEVYGYVSFLTILIACLGLFGLASYMTERRIREIGIRKIMGASVTGIVGLLTSDFLKLVAISIAIVIPIAYWYLNFWLQNYAYRIDLNWWLFGLGGGMALGIAMLTVSWQAFRAALANPAEVIRHE